MPFSMAFVYLFFFLNWAFDRKQVGYSLSGTPECKHFKLPVMWEGVCFKRHLSLACDCHPEGPDRKACIHRRRRGRWRQILFKQSLSSWSASLCRPVGKKWNDLLVRSHGADHWPWILWKCVHVSGFLLWKGVTWSPYLAGVHGQLKLLLTGAFSHDALLHGLLSDNSHQQLKANLSNRKPASPPHELCPRNTGTWGVINLILILLGFSLCACFWNTSIFLISDFTDLLLNCCSWS